MLSGFGICYLDLKPVIWKDDPKNLNPFGEGLDPLLKGFLLKHFIKVFY